MCILASLLTLSWAYRVVGARVANCYAPSDTFVRLALNGKQFVTKFGELSDHGTAHAISMEGCFCRSGYEHPGRYGFSSCSPRPHVELELVKYRGAVATEYLMLYCCTAVPLIRTAVFRYYIVWALCYITYCNPAGEADSIMCILYSSYCWGKWPAPEHL